MISMKLSILLRQQLHVTELGCGEPTAIVIITMSCITLAEVTPPDVSVTPVTPPPVRSVEDFVPEEALDASFLEDMKEASKDTKVVMNDDNISDRCGTS